MRKFDKYVGKLRPQKVECLSKVTQVLRKWHIKNKAGSEMNFVLNKLFQREKPYHASISIHHTRFKVTRYKEIKFNVNLGKKTQVPTKTIMERILGEVLFKVTHEEWILLQQANV